VRGILSGLSCSGKAAPLAIAYCWRACLAGLVCVAVAGSAWCREPRTDESRNTLYVEFLGNAGLYSLNYERVFATIAQRHRIGARIGVGLVPIDTLGVRFPLVIPVTVNYLLGRQRRLETGIGVTPRIYFRPDWSADVRFSPALTIGYRLQRFDNDFNFRIGFTPLFFEKFLPWFGLSLGRSF